MGCNNEPQLKSQHRTDNSYENNKSCFVKNAKNEKNKHYLQGSCKPVPSTTSTDDINVRFDDDDDDGSDE